MILPEVHLQLSIGPVVPIPAPPFLLEALESVSVSHSDQGHSGFQLSFNIGRSGPEDIVDYKELLLPLLRPFNRAIITVEVAGIPHVLMDGLLTNQQLQPGREPGQTLLTVTGEDVSLAMDMEQVITEHPAQIDALIATKIIASYPQYGLVPLVIPPVVFDPPIVTDRTPVQNATDRQYLEQMAGRYGHIFVVIPGPAPGMNLAYWGPPVRIGVPQPALTVNMGPATNVESINFDYNARAPQMVMGTVQDRYTGADLPIITLVSTRMPPLASQPALPFNLPNVRMVKPRQVQGQSYIGAFAQAQGLTDASTDNVVTASGSVDTVRYGWVLQPRALVGVRGVGYSYDGFYYVRSVSHSIRKGEYKQSFSLSREGAGSTTPVVVP